MYYYFYEGITGSVNLTAHRMTKSWKESTLTWNELADETNFGLESTPLAAGFADAGNALQHTPKTVDFSITTTFKKWVGGSFPNYGIGVKYVSPSESMSVIFYASESGATYSPRFIYSYVVNGEYFSALQEIYGFSANEATLIMKLYSRVAEKAPGASIYETAWKSSRLLGGFVYGNSTSLTGTFSAFRWKDVAGKVFEGSEEEYFVNTLGYTSAEYTQLKSLIRAQNNTALSANEGDFAHMQITLAARLAYYLDFDGDFSNVVADDETVSYLAGWLGDAVVVNDGTTSFGNDDYIADLDAENIYRQIISGKSILSAADDYYTNLSSSNRAQIFTSYISYDTIKENVYYELIDKELYNRQAIAAAQGDWVTAEMIMGLIESEEYHEELIENDYPDTHDFLQSIYYKRHTIGDY